MKISPLKHRQQINKYVGCSPDGLISKDGGIEIKCPSDYTYLGLISKKDLVVNSNYEWQIQMCLLITGRKWWDYVVYNPNYKKDMLIKRILPDKEKHEKLLSGFEKGEKQLQNLINELKLYGYRKTK